MPSFYPFASDFDTGASVTVEAVPAPGYSFDGWSGDLSGSDNPASLVITCNKNITAIFSRIGYTLTVGVAGNGSSDPPVGAHDYDEGTEVTITAIPDDGWQFRRWSGDVTDPGSATTTVTMDSDKTFTAEFSLVQAAEPNWWLVAGIVAGVMVVGVVVRVVTGRGIA